MTPLHDITARAAPHRLGLFGALRLTAEDGLSPEWRSLVLLGPEEPGFWAHVTAEPEWSDGKDDPIDRWSARVIGEIADALGALAVYPFGGPPHRPFFNWALRSGRAFASPVTLLVHDRAGLFVSYRGALALAQDIDLPPPAANPCETCADKPCLTACPAGALGATGYDVPACHDFLDLPEGQDCLSRGCAVRRACPLSKAYGRVEEQSAYHMRLFHK
ncbi:ferredoxin [Frigidibacter sp. SD6-1]|uniref:ferredoxin n=1 Tax=Frigidibacter sp. SD6-1 TaxID=3032581 RepID=UPI0024DF87B8|nr:ferredoxin [Frigidibacter sp. SD6-1]